MHAVMIPKQDGRESKKHPSATSKSWERHVPFDFTGYTVHIEITERSNDGEITRIIGSFAHNASPASICSNPTSYTRS